MLCVSSAEGVVRTEYSVLVSVSMKTISEAIAFSSYLTAQRVREHTRACVRSLHPPGRRTSR